jgi:hypothetical protein
LYVRPALIGARGPIDKRKDLIEKLKIVIPEPLMENRLLPAGTHHVH